MHKPYYDLIAQSSRLQYEDLDEYIFMFPSSSFFLVPSRMTSLLFDTTWMPRRLNTTKLSLKPWRSVEKVPNLGQVSHQSVVRGIVQVGPQMEGCFWGGTGNLSRRISNQSSEAKLSAQVPSLMGFPRFGFSRMRFTNNGGPNQRRL